LDEELLRYLRERVPEYMVPSAIVLLDELPLTPNRKVDVHALPAPSTVATAPKELADEPGDELESALTAFWCELLHRDRIGVRDDFFRLGGNSLLVMRIIGHVKKGYGIRVPGKYVFENPTVSALARLIRDGGTGAE
jgi:acyl carrier protein